MKFLQPQPCSLSTELNSRRRGATLEFHNNVLLFFSLLLLNLVFLNYLKPSLRENILQVLETFQRRDTLSRLPRPMDFTWNPSLLSCIQDHFSALEVVCVTIDFFFSFHFDPSWDMFLPHLASLLGVMEITLG